MLETKISNFKIDKLPNYVPVFPLQGALLLPGGRLPLNIFEPQYIQMTKDTLTTSDRMIVMTQPYSDGSSNKDIYKLGCAGKIISFEETLDGRFLICLAGILRCTLKDDIQEDGGYRRMSADFSKFLKDMKPKKESIDRDGFLNALKPFFDLKGLSADWEAIKACDDDRLITTLAMICPFSNVEKQALLEADTLNERANLMKVMLEMGSFEEGDLNAKKH